MRFVLLIFLIFLCQINAITIDYGYSTGILNYNQNILLHSVDVPCFKTFTIIHSLASVNISSYFSYFSNYTITEGVSKNDLSISIMIGGTKIFRISIEYAVMQQMPNIEVSFLNLTYQKPVKVYNSKKGLTFDESTYITSHLVGFSSSNITKDNFFYAVKNSITYSIYTNTILREDDWIAINLIILQQKYNMNDIICIGSSILFESEIYASSNNVILQFVIENQLQFIVGLQALQNGSSQFILNKINHTINIGGFGMYSYSIIIINNTCNYLFDEQLYQQTQKEKKYLGLMLTFLILFILLALIATVYFLKNKTKKKIIVRVLQEPKQQHNLNTSIMRQQELKSNNDNPKFSSPKDEQYIQNQGIELNDQRIPQTQIRLKSFVIKCCSKCSQQLNIQNKCPKCIG